MAKALEDIDGVRDLPPQTEGGEGYIFINLNRGKKSITLNLGSERGQQICKELLKKVDVVAENFTPGVMDRLGLGYEELRKVNPGLIYASLSGFGHTGPRSHQPAFDTLAQATGGFMSITGYRDGPPTKGGTAIADFFAGLYTAISILAALQYKSKTGEGQYIDISMQDSIWAITAAAHAPFYFTTGENPPRIGNSQIEATPFSAFPAKDGWVIIAIVTVGQWQNLLHVIGREDLLGEVKYATQV